MEDLRIDEIEETVEDMSDEDMSDDSPIFVPSEERNIIWQAKDFSIRELRDLEDEGTLNLSPSYQRNFVTDTKSASKMIESLLMDMPIPVIYLAEEKDGTYSVIDGKQRLTTFIYFLKGVYPSPDNKKFVLRGLKVLDELNGKCFAELDKKHQQKIKTSTLHIIIIKKESNEDIKFEIFERLNTGSVKLNQEEIRNSVYRGSYMELLAELEKDPILCKIVDKPNLQKRMIYRGYIHRFIVLTEKTYLNYSEGKQFMNREMRENRNITKQKQDEYRKRFKKAIEMSYSVFGNRTFKRFVVGDRGDINGKWMNIINLCLFDIIMCGFARYEKHQIIPKADTIREALIHLMTNDEKFIRSIEMRTHERASMHVRFKIWYDVLDSIIDNTTNKRYFPQSLREQIYSQNNTCSICSQKIMTIDDAEIDHIIPFSMGGSTTIENAQITHRYCNRSKGNKMS